MAQGRPEDFEALFGDEAELKRALDDMAKRLFGATSSFRSGFATGGTTNTAWHHVHDPVHADARVREINPRSAPPPPADRSGVRQFEFSALLELFYTDAFGRRVSVLNTTGGVATIATDESTARLHQRVAAAIQAMQRMDGQP